MAKLSYTNTKITGQFDFSEEDLDIAIGAIMKTGPHSEYSADRKLLNQLITGRRVMIQESLNRVENRSLYTDDVINYPEVKEAS